MERLIIPLLLLVFCQDGCGSIRSAMSLTKSDARSLKQALGIYEDNYFTFQELTGKYGFPSEKHTVVTADGYILTVFRLLSKCEETNKYPVLLTHGLFDSSDTWIINGPKRSLGYILSANCYDVWITNRRGNSYARKHVRLNPDTDIEYWDFSFDESGNYDLPAVTDHILNVTEANKINFISHSQGTTEFFVMTSLRPEYNDKVNIAIHLAPVAWFRNLNSPFLNIVAPSTREIKNIFDVLGFRELFGRYQLSHVALEALCNIAPGPICATSLFLATGSRDLVSFRRLPIIFGHILDGVSTKGIAHFGQLMVSKKFQRYDEGRLLNLKKYGTPYPPQYNVSLITSPNVLIGSQSDWIASVKDVKYLSSKLPNVLETYIIPTAAWSHNDHLWADSAPKKLYPKILGYLERFNA